MDFLYWWRRFTGKDHWKYKMSDGEVECWSGLVPFWLAKHQSTRSIFGTGEFRYFPNNEKKKPRETR